MTESMNYRALYHLARTMHHHRDDPRSLMQTALMGTSDLTGIQQGCVVTFQDELTILNAYVLNGEQDTKEERTTVWEILLSHGLIGFVYQSHRTIIIRDIASDSRWPPLPENPSLPQHGSAIGLPLYQGARVFGVMMVLHSEVDYFDDLKVHLLEEIAGLTAECLIDALTQPPQENVRYHALFQDAVVPIMLTNLDGTIIDVNYKARDLLMYEYHQLVRHSIDMVHPDLDIKNLVQGGLSTLLPQEEVIFDATVRSAEGYHIPVLLRLRRLHLDGRDVVEWVEQDITPQMELEQLRRDLSAMVYHDLRGPLSSIHGSIQKLAQVLANHENPLVLSLLQIGVRSTRQLRRMIDSLLDVQRIEAGSAILNCQTCEMRVLLADAVQLVQPVALDMNQTIQFEVQPDLPSIEIDTEMILRVVINLAENAIKYTPSGGTIKLRAYQEDESIHISVTDSGPGIPRHLQTRIFEKFNRIKYKDAPKGLGLGLAFCRLAVEAHGGTIWVESEGENGSTFVMRLPFVAPKRMDKFSTSELAGVSGV